MTCRPERDPAKQLVEVSEGEWVYAKSKAPVSLDDLHALNGG